MSLKFFSVFQVQDINVLEEVIRMVLEILNSVLSHQLAHNKHLIYTLLYKKHVFDAFRSYDATQDLVYNMDLVSKTFNESIMAITSCLVKSYIYVFQVISYFTKRLGDEHKNLSVTEVMDRIQDGVRHWSPELLRVIYICT